MDDSSNPTSVAKTTLEAISEAIVGAMVGEGHNLPSPTAQGDPHPACVIGASPRFSTVTRKAWNHRRKFAPKLKHTSRQGIDLTLHPGVYSNRNG